VLINEGRRAGTSVGLVVRSRVTLVLESAHNNLRTKDGGKKGWRDETFHKNYGIFEKGGNREEWDGGPAQIRLNRNAKPGSWERKRGQNGLSWTSTPGATVVLSWVYKTKKKEKEPKHG